MKQFYTKFIKITNKPEVPIKSPNSEPVDFNKKEKPKTEPLTLQEPPLVKMKVEDDEEPLETEKTKTGFVKEDENDWNEDGFLDIPYDDEIIDPIDDYVDYEVPLVDNEVVYRLRENYSRVTRSELNTEKEPLPDAQEEVIEAIPLEKADQESLKEEEVKATPVVHKKEEIEHYDDESRILPVEKQTIMMEKGGD